ncbi:MULTISPECIES: nicotinate-nucleotide adenylyltransferase [unclassified Bacillus (in: firmicutes)]|uniref:nicotinate-nucleotide adenylyltransferase n=1 Tax=unclassified Bacillus (in: firmicutes) TaxID=185979 RepID=UPI0008E6D699|nr:MULTISPECIES: nicotinate-nucleotide adenylyltransferase [unclassified Bacillus (in: firmicutes)]SFA95301.1 nicotinate-nucleotide adenylyltransferase [Bacillus sp. UNCCL13]SFQ79013.1 nicotinate-nucleotide adenylyltransferase [Bacillus sp. cl95]
MKKIGILGGTFDPPHNGHLLIANEVLNALQLEEIWFMPNQEPPHKKRSNSVSNDDRVQMLELAISDNKRFKIEKIELERHGPSYTIDTMKILTEIHKEYRFYFIIGADMVEYLPKWNKIEELISLVKFVGVQRPGYKVESDFPILYVEVPQMEISSSDIRARIQKGKPVKYLLPDSVISYMMGGRLYESGKSLDDRKSSID